jgi:putative FmdB family regulatory protein
MPLYEYLCDACGHRFEAIQKFSDPPLETCPKCGGAVRKQQAAPAFQFKGSGWYITDYAKKDGSAKGGKADDAAKTGGDSESAAKTEKTDKTEKPAAPAPSKD